MRAFSCLIAWSIPAHLASFDASGIPPDRDDGGATGGLTV
jgi:hypothetical protein